MGRRIIVALVVFVLSFTATLQLTSLTTTFASDSGSNHWTIAVTVCENGFKVKATGGTDSGSLTEVRVDKVIKILPYDKPPFILQTEPVAFTSPTGSMFVANSSNLHIQVVGTGYFYFPEAQAVNSRIETVIVEYINGGLAETPARDGIDYVNRCQIPGPVPPVKDLSGVYNPDTVNRGPDAFGNDGRAFPDKRDHVAVYCVNTGPDAGTIVINGLDGGGGAYRLAQFKQNDVAAVSPRGITVLAYDNHGVVMLQSGGVYHMEWTGGPWSANEVKEFTCNFDKSLYNKTPNQLKYPDTFGNDGRVAPNATDHEAVYCNVSAGTIVVMGVNRDGSGYGLATFKYGDVLTASPNPISIDAQKNGTAFLRVDNDDNFYFEWKNGPWSAYEAKGFRCRF